MSRPIISPFFADAPVHRTPIGSCIRIWLLLTLMLSAQVQATTFTVNQMTGTGAGTLHQAILNANADPSASNASPHRIVFTVSSVNLGNNQLPVISRPTYVNYHGSNVVTISSNHPDASGTALRANARVTLQALAIEGSQTHTGITSGVDLQAGASGSVLRGVGIRNMYSWALRVQANDVLVTDQTLLPGGATGVRRNSFVRIEGTDAIQVLNVSSFTLLGSDVGRGHTGGVLRNFFSGLLLSNVNGATIGNGDRTLAAGRNVFLANNVSAIRIGNNSRNVLVQGNWIGVDPDDPGADTGNGVDNAAAVLVVDSTDIRLGRTDSANSGNIIGKNRQYGVQIQTSDDVRFYHNHIGRLPGPGTAMGNRHGGIYVHSSRAPHKPIIIGDVTMPWGNMLAFNGQAANPNGGIRIGVSNPASGGETWIGRNWLLSNHGGAITGPRAEAIERPVIYLADSVNNRIRGRFPFPSAGGLLSVWTDPADQATSWRGVFLLGPGTTEFELPVDFQAIDPGRNLTASNLMLTDDPLTDGSSTLTAPARIGPPNTLNLHVAGPGGVDANLGPIFNCTSNCQAEYSSNMSVTLTAAWGPGGVSFQGWSGDACNGSTNPSCTVTMSQSRNVTATFAPLQRALTVNKTGQGTVTSNPAGINCGATCSASFNHGTQVTLTAAPTAGWTFSGWSGEGCTGTGTCMVNMSQARTVTANFAQQQQFTLTVNKTGQGTVTSNPAGINCGATCSASFNHGTQVTLTAAPTAGWTFSGWSGEGCTGTGTCMVNMSQARTVTANFAQQQQFTLTVNKTGQGTVTSNPAGINCGATCSASFNHGTQVTLTATPATGWQFGNWSGACAGSGACTVSMTQARSVTATFTQTSQSHHIFASGFEPAPD